MSMKQNTVEELVSRLLHSSIHLSICSSLCVSELLSVLQPSTKVLPPSEISGYAPGAKYCYHYLCYKYKTVPESSLLFPPLFKTKLK